MANVKMVTKTCQPVCLAVITCLALMASISAPSELYAQEWELVWSDEFEGGSLDEDKWSYQYGTGSSEGLNGWGNNELQYYTDREENIFIEDEMLHIVAREESHEGSNYTSARIRTINQGDWRYGRFEIRAKLPKGQGIWPAIWMMPTENVYGGWAASGEIDIMELVGHEPDAVHGTLHYGGQWPENTYSGNEYQLDDGTFNDDFHTFALEWEEGEIRWYVDGENYQTQTDWHSSDQSFPAPFDEEFHMIMNVAVGGDWPGSPDGSTQFPQEMVIDYIRVYQDADSDNGNGGPGTGGPATPDDLIPVSLPILFDDPDFNWNMAFFGFDGGSASVADNPQTNEINDSERVGRMIKDGGQFWGGAFTYLEEAFVFDEEEQTISMKVWSPREGVPVLMKVEQQDGSAEYEIAEPTTTSNEWEELTWDMSEAGTETEWDVITLIFDLEDGQVGDGSENFTWYFDELSVYGVDQEHTSAETDHRPGDIPLRHALHQNYPNPFNPNTNIRFDLPEQSDVSLEVFDITGRRIALLSRGHHTAGTHTVSFDASGLSSGVYFYHLQADDFLETRHMTLVK